MQEYKREKATLETKLKELSKSAAFHNDHLRVIDAWFKQVSVVTSCPSQRYELTTFHQLIDELKILLCRGDEGPQGKS